jgi:hypothetical protein
MQEPKSQTKNSPFQSPKTNANDAQSSLSTPHDIILSSAPIAAPGAYAADVKISGRQRRARSLYLESAQRYRCTHREYAS